MSFFCLFILGLLFFILQTTIFQNLSCWAAMLDPLFVLMVFCAIRLKLISGAIFILLFSLLLDVFFGLFPGLYPVVYLTLYSLLRWLIKIIAIKERLQKIVLVVTSFLFVSFATYVFLNLLIPDNIPSWSWPDFLEQSALLALITVPLFNLFELLTVKMATQSRPQSWGAWEKTNRFKD